MDRNKKRLDTSFSFLKFMISITYLHNSMFDSMWATVIDFRTLKV